jgi:transcriptional regulator with XRE-family HTH domain
MALRTLRLQAGYSQEELASKGISRGHISEMEHGMHDPRLSTLQRLAELLHVPFSALTAEIERQYEQLRTKSGAASVYPVDLDVQGDILLVTAAGTAEFHACLRLHREALDCAQQRQVRKVLLDCQDVDGEVPAQGKYQIATEILAYAAERKIDLRLALVGRPPTMDGYVARAIRDLGGDAEVFTSVDEARVWLDQR